MAEELFVPKMGQTVEQVTLVNWLVKDGDKVSQGQEVLEVETDKAVFNVEAVDSGYIHMGPYNAGDVLPVLTVVAIIGDKDEQFEVKETKPVPQEKPEEALKTGAALSQPAELKEQKVETTPQSGLESSAEKQFVSPRARKLAGEKNINLNLITPTGGGGIRVQESDVIAFISQSPRISPLAKAIAAESGLDIRSIFPSGTRGEITRADVEMALARKAAEKQIPKVTAQFAALPLPDLEISDRFSLKGIRSVIAERMGASSRITARVTLFADVDATLLVEIREKLKTKVEKDWGFAPGYNDLIAKICAHALRQFPNMNARINSEIIEQLAPVNIGIAVDAEKGLYVPVIRDADKKNLQEIGTEFRQRVNEVRSGKILPDHLTGGTFTITNLGMYEVEGFTPIINLPEAAILGVGQIIPKPVVRADSIVIRQIMTLSLAFDHRLVDGAPAAKFLQFLKEQIQAPDEVLLS